MVALLSLIQAQGTYMAWAWGACFVFGVLLVVTKRWHGQLTLDFTEGIQKFHTAPTPRIGGVPIVLALLVVWGRVGAEVQTLLTPILMAGLPAFLFGVAEDITKRVGVLHRLLATMASGVLAWWLTGYSLMRLDVPGLDLLLQWLPLSVLFTAFAVGGVANSINIIDGFNGLASLSTTLAFLGLAGVAHAVGDSSLAVVCLMLAAAVFGFFCVNWPFGKLFLGDGGSYFIGFALAWVAVLLVQRNSGVTAFAALLVCVHPITEVLFSIFRRKVRKEHPGMPDRLHFHSLFKRRYVARWFATYPATLRNSIAGFLMGAMTLPAVVLVQWTYQSAAWSVVVVLALGFGYVALYARMVRHQWCSPVDFLLIKSVQ